MTQESRRYAQRTRVPAERSETELRQYLARQGAADVMTGVLGGHVVVAFKLRDRLIRFVIPLPDVAEARKQVHQSRRGRRYTDADVQAWREVAIRERWRALVATVKARFVSIAARVETFEVAFFAHTVVPGTGGKTTAELALPALAESYESGEPPSLARMMLGPGSAS